MLAFRRLLILTIALCFSWGLWNSPARASMPLNDQFKATEACQAFQSIRKSTNPEDIRLTPGETYRVTAKNKEDPTHYYLRIENAEPVARWVSTSCGELLGTPPTRVSQSPNPENLLAINWQPAFCETHQNKTECASQTEERFDASNFTLHGLWPQPRNHVYCNVSSKIKNLDRAKQWSKLPSIGLSDELLKELEVKMPGVASNLHLHPAYLTQNAIAIDRTLTRYSFETSVNSCCQTTVCCLSSSQY